MGTVAPCGRSCPGDLRRPTKPHDVLAVFRTIRAFTRSSTAHPEPACSLIDIQTVASLTASAFATPYAGSC